MARYGLDYYDLVTYGPSSVSAYADTNLIASPQKIGYIKVSWTSPYGDWSKIKLTRNSYGFPIDPWDGTELDIAKDGLNLAFKETDPTIFKDDQNLGQNTFYYYSLFVFENSTNRWQRVGDAIALSAGDYGYTDLMYDALPAVYKVNSLGDPLLNTENEDLYNFLSLFGFQLNLAHTYTNLLVNRYSVEKVGGTLMPSFMQQFGLAYEPEIGYQQERIILQNSVLINKERGSKEGLIEYIKSYSGYEVADSTNAPNPNDTGLTVGPNLMLDYNDSSFEESSGHWESPDASALLYSLKEQKVTKLSLSSNVATLTVGAHSYKVGQKVYATGFVYPLFNTGATPFTITSVTATTISFSLTGADVTEINAYNNSTEDYPLVSPYPAPWEESTTPVGYPNKQKGILSVKNANSSSGTAAFSCGSSNSVLKGIPVEVGQTYSFSVYSAANSTTRTITLGIDWYDRFGTYISSDLGSGTANAAGQFTVRLQVTNKIAPSGAYYAVPTISIASSAGSSSNEWHYFDAAQFEASATVTNFDEARQIHLTATANRINELVNPHFAGTTSALPWTTTGGSDLVVENQIEPTATGYSAIYLTLGSGIANLESSLTSDLVPGDVIYVKGVSGVTDGVYTVTEWFPASTAYSSYVTFDTGTLTTAARTPVTGEFYKASTSLEVTTSGSSVVVDSWDGVDIAQQMNIFYPDTEYTFSVYIKSSGVDDEVTLLINWYDTSNVLIGTSTGIPLTITKNPGDLEWDRPYVTDIAPSTAAYATVSATFETNTGQTILLDSALFEHESFVFPFFSGNGGTGDSTSFMWEGGLSNENNARSHYYKNYSVISNRLANGALTDQMVLGSTAAIYYAQPNT